LYFVFYDDYYSYWNHKELERVNSLCPACSGLLANPAASVAGNDYYSNGPHKELKE
jgi:hypothetical protein